MVNECKCLLLVMFLSATAAMAQQDPDPTWQLGESPAEAWFDRSEGWEALDPRALPGRGQDAAGVRYLHHAAGGESGQGAVSVTFEPATMGPDDRLSLLICSRVPPNRTSRVTGYEITLDREGRLQILRLDGGDAPVLLESSAASTTPLDASLSYVLAVERSGAGIEARVRVAGAGEPTSSVAADDDRYLSGHVGVALPQGAGRVAAVTIVPAEPAEPAGPGQPGKPAW